MKIKIKKKLQSLEEAKTFADTVKEMDGKFTKSLQGILNADPDSEAIRNIKIHLRLSVPDDLQDGEKVEVLNWLKKKVLTPKGDDYSFLVGMAGDPLVPGRISKIEKFYKIKEFASEKQIMKISSFEEMDDIIDKAEPKWAAAEEKRIKKSSGKVDKKNLRIEELQSSDPNWEIFLPHDQNAAMHLGSICFSHWCTSARSTQNMFSNYYKKDDPLIVFKHKTQKEKIIVNRGDGKEIETEVPLMYQIHFGKAQFMDRNDHQVKRDEKMLLLNLIQNSKTEDGKLVKEKYPVINTIKMYETEKGIIERQVLDDGSEKWYLNGKRHREDGPAIRKPDGTKQWYLNGQLHRDDGPAIEYSDGTKEWYVYDNLHREDGPAVEKANGTKKWYQLDEPHREDGPAIEKADGTREWYQNGELHREDGPALERSDGTKEWYQNGELHREDGPAILSNYVKAWFLNGDFYKETYWNDTSTPEVFIEAGGKEWDWKNDPWYNKGSLKEHFGRFHKLWL